MRVSSAWLGLCMAAVLSTGLAGARPAAAQPMLYEQRLPEGFAFVRFANTLPGRVTVKPDYDNQIAVPDGAAERVTAYMVAEDVAKRPVKLVISDGTLTTEVTVQIPSGGYNTVLLRRDGDRLGAVVITDKVEFNQTRARLGFYPAITGCAEGGLAIDPGSQAIFSKVAPETGVARNLNPAAAKVIAYCGGQRAPLLDLGRLEAGQQYSVWLMAPQGTPVSFLVRDRIAAR
ncbi:ABC transporter permease [Roseomonas sp. USHLN139]|uniref:ABC transporter permease n=1 Tax=Roseomonas sp. USHLN139 TaxID=3081298 RepID=UPI003B025D12